MSCFEVITEYEPIRLLMQVERPSDASLRAFLDAELERLCDLRRRGRRVVVILDGSCGCGMSRAQDEMGARWVAEHSELLEDTLIGVVVLAGDGARARDWFSALAVPRFVSADFEAALDRVFAWVEDDDEALAAPLVFQHDALLRSLGCAA